MRQRAGWTSVALFALALSLPGCGLHGKPKIERKSPTSVSNSGAAVASQDPREVVAPGVVEPWGGEVDLSPQESGYIAEILVREGERIESGALLAVLDDGAQRAAVDLANADLAEAQTALAKTLRGATKEEREEAEAQVDASRARAESAQRDANREQRLQADRAIAPAAAERSAATAEEQAAAARAGAARLAAIVRGARAEDRSAARDRVDAARARLSLAEASLERRRVVAPISGTVLVSRAHAGEFTSVGTAPLFVLGDTTRLQVRLEIDEIDAFRLRDGDPCTVYGDDNTRLTEGAVFRLAPKMGRRGLSIESPTARADVRVREVFVEARGASSLVPGRRVWGHVATTESSGQLASKSKGSLIE
jgi:multidrug resistance efflux pump